MSATTEDWLPRHRLTVEDYHRMGEMGLLAPDARTELINGEIIDMTPPGSRHSAIVTYLTHALTAAVGNAALVSVRSPLRLNRMNEPQPDLQILRKRDDFYVKALPAGPDVLLAIEVSDSTLRYDRQIKLPLYAAHGIGEFWLIDLNAKQMTCCRKPRDHRYENVIVLGSAQLREPVTTISGFRIELSRLFELAE